MSCAWCGDGPLSEASCCVAALHVSGSPLGLIRAGDEPWWPWFAWDCSGCGVRRGGLHHSDCLTQACPLCVEPLFQSQCGFDEFPPLSGCDCQQCEDARARKFARVIPEVEPLGTDRNGRVVTRYRMPNGVPEIIVVFDPIAECDRTEIDGLTCTTPLRTVIDIAGSVVPDDLPKIVEDCLHRGSFTVDEALQRLDAPEMRARRDLDCLRGALLAWAEC